MAYIGKTIAVYQVKRNELENMFPESPMHYGIGKYDPVANIDKYHHVATVNTDDHELAFTIMNRWSEDDVKMVRCHRPLHSMSVGDILVDNDETVRIVADCGFDELNIYIDGEPRNL